MSWPIRVVVGVLMLLGIAMIALGVLTTAEGFISLAFVPFGIGAMVCTFDVWRRTKS
jgi:hypothetical protein